MEPAKERGVKAAAPAIDAGVALGAALAFAVVFCAPAVAAVG